MANLHFRKKKIAEFHGILDFLLIFEFSRLFLNATLRVKFQVSGLMWSF